MLVLNVLLTISCDIALIMSAVQLYKQRHLPAIMWRGWIPIANRIVLLFLFLNMLFIGNELLPDKALCGFCFAILLVFYSFVGSVVVQCWDVLVCWTSLASIIAVHPDDSRHTLAAPSAFLRLTQRLRSPQFEFSLGVVIAIVTGAASLSAIIASGATITNPTGGTMINRCGAWPTPITAGVVFAVACFLVVATWRLRHLDDHFGLRIELFGLSATLSFFAVLIVISRYEPGSSGLVTAQMVVLATFSAMLSLAWPMFVAWKTASKPKKMSMGLAGGGILAGVTRRKATTTLATSKAPKSSLTSSSTLIEVLQDEHGGRALFKRYCISEFSLENILWLETSDRLRRKYDKMANTDPDEFMAELRLAAKIFLRSDGVLCLNLPSSTTEMTLAFIDEGGGVGDIEQGLDIVQRIDMIVLDLMKDTFSRFRASSMYVEFLKELSGGTPPDPQLVNDCPSLLISSSPTK